MTLPVNRYYSGKCWGQMLWGEVGAYPIVGIEGKEIFFEKKAQ